MVYSVCMSAFGAVEMFVCADMSVSICISIPSIMLDNVVLICSSDPIGMPATVMPFCDGITMRLCSLRHLSWSTFDISVGEYIFDLPTDS